MPLKIKDSQGVPSILSLDDSEIVTWRQLYGKIRAKELLKPGNYIDKAVEKLGGKRVLAERASNPTELIFDIRETAWQIYIEHEQVVSGKALALLLRENPEARQVLSATMERDGLESYRLGSDKDLVDKLSVTVGEVSGRIFPYVYELAKSITNSRRSRAGTSFERIIHHIIDAKGIPYDKQSKTGTAVFAKAGLGKKVDGLVPSIEAYGKIRSRCAILTMKTTLRERWQEVVEEIERTKVPHIYLLTLDDALNDSNLETMKNHNITLVVPDYVQKANAGKQNVMSFEKLFNEDLPHVLKYWENN